jgi:hypothetical protein
MRETMPAIFELVRVKGDGWKVYHPERGYIGRLKRQSANGARRLLWAARVSREEHGA